jgi:Cu+-exporting ATPase
MSSCCSCSTNPTRASDASCEAPMERAGDWMRLVFAALVAAQSMIFGLAVSISPPEGTARLVLHWTLAASAVVVFLLVGGPVVRAAWAGLRARRVVMEQLFLAGILGAFFASLQCTLTGVGDVYYEVVAILLAIYTFGQLLGEQRRQAALSAAQELGAEFAHCERLRPGGGLEEVPVEAIAVGDVVRVAAGAGIPVDGVVQTGVAFVRESALTGEAFPVVKRAGDTVWAGSYCVDQGLEIRAQSAGRGRTLDGLLNAVRQAQAGRSRLQREADRLVAWFLPIVMVVAGLTFAGWTWASGWQVGLFHALAVLVVACPCSMGLATPIGIWATLGALVRRGLVVRDSELVEALGRADTVVFDKTGTLGEERLELVDFVAWPEESREEILRRVAVVEGGSNHPIARSFRQAKAAGEEFCASMEVLPGIGLAGVVDGVRVAVGNAGLWSGARETPSEVGRLRSLLREGTEGSHEVWVRQDGRVVGLGVLREKLRDSARPALVALQEAGLRVVVMTGDRAEAAARHGFEECWAGLSATEKAEKVRSLQAEGRRVLFVGDGVNDAPAMAEATGAIAIGQASALARETAPGTLVHEDLQVLPYAVERCRATLRAIRRNLGFAAIYNVVGIALAAAGVIHPVVAALLMLGSSLTVTWRALRETQEEKILPQRSPSRPKKAISPAAGLVALPKWAVWALAAAILVQGPVVAYLGGFRGTTALGFVLLFASAGLLVAAWGRVRVWTRPAAMATSMFGLGGLLMLVGWWMDAGFAAVVRDGVCLCGCASSGMGWGLFLQPNWMLAGMVVASLPTVRLEPVTGTSQRWICWAAGLAGMIFGMEISALLMALVPVTEAAAGLHFFATYGVMVLGMTWGMFAACQMWLRWQEKKRSTEND